MIKVIVTDIEGTTGSIHFVHQVLFPYARQHLPDYLRQHAETPAVAEQIAAVRALMEQPDASLEAVIEQLLSWIAEDRKITPLKALQGMVWEHGYRSGAFKGHVYPDALQRLRAWQQQGVRLYVYSSGSVAAQQLLFGYSEYGDLTPLFSGYFDTRIGGKKEADSYRAIVREVGVAPAEILFLSDVEAELDAARAAGLQTCWLVREGELPSNASHPVARTFDAIHAL